MDPENKKKNNTEESNVVKDTPGRSLAKAISWRIIASLTTFLITFVIFRQQISGPYKDILQASTLVMIFDVVLKIAIYYFHERLWMNITWGKFMDRNYWKSRAWRSLYRKMHDNSNNNTLK